MVQRLIVFSVFFGTHSGTHREDYELMTATPTYLLSRPSGYYFRIRVPHDLKDILRVSEIKSAIHHTNRSQAFKTARRLSVITESLFDEIRLNPYQWTKDEFKTWRKQYLRKEHTHRIPSYDSKEAPTHKHAPRLNDIIEKYTAEQTTSGQWTRKSQLENEATYRLATRIIGNISSSHITFEHIRNYKDTLRHLPANINKNPLYKEKSIDAILAMHPKPMAINTINKNISRLSSLLKWAMKHGYIAMNYAEGMQLKLTKRPDEEREAYNHNDLTTLFSSKIYKDNMYKHSYYFWLPLLGLFTGARLNELCQLYLNDIQKHDDIWIIDINNNSEDKRIKSKASKRQIPVHPTLLNIGFVTHIEKLKEKGETRLFPELKKRRDGYGQDASKWFRRLRLELGITEKDFHSFRHTFAANLRNNGARFEDISDILGHSNSTTTARYTKGISIRKAYQCILLLKFKIHLSTILFNNNQ